MDDIKIKLGKAKIGLMMNTGSVFLSTIAFNMIHIFDEKVQVAATDGIHIVYNPKVFITLNPKQRIGLMAHEAWHVALMHMTRGSKKNHEIYNEAGDHVINILLIDAGFELPAGGLCDFRFRGMSTNQVYNILIKENPNPKKRPDSDIIYASGNTGKEKEIKKIESNIKEILVKAITQAKMQKSDIAGSIPGEVLRTIDELINPKLSWHEILNRFLTNKAQNDYSWSKLDMRFFPEFYLPSLHSESLGEITIAIDTSGSISKKDLTKILTEIEYIHTVLKPSKLTIIDCDNKINHIHEITQDIDISSLKFTGGGGSRCHPVIEYCNKHEPAALIYFTDLYLPPYTKAIDYPLLWIVYNNPNAKVQVGEITHYDIGINNGY